MSITKSIKISAIDILAATLVAALVVVVPAPLRAQQAAPPKSAATETILADQENEAPTPQKPGGEGIKVHGHWVLDVRDKNGNIVDHRDFHNSLVLDGASAIVSLLGGRVSAEQMEVGLGTASNQGMFGLYVSSSAFGVGATCTNYYGTCYPNLTRSYGSTNSQLSSIILSGTIPGQSSAYALTNVSTMLNSCGVSTGTGATTVSPSACNGTINTTNPGNQFYISNFTAATISSLAVAAGQSLSVTVTLSFS